MDHVPAIALEARADRLAEGQRGVAFDRDRVVVVDPTQVRQLEMAGERGGFVGDPLHHVAVAAKREDVVVEQLETRPIEMRGQPALGDRHAHAVGNPLPQRTGCRFDAASFIVLRMTRRAAVKLPEFLDLLQCHGQFAGRLTVGAQLLHAGQVQHGIEQHRRMPARQHEPVAVRPGGIVRVELQQLVPKRIGNRGQGHGRPGMPAVGGLDRVHGQCANRRDRQLVDRDFGGGHISTVASYSEEMGKNTENTEPERSGSP